MRTDLKLYAHAGTRACHLARAGGLGALGNCVLKLDPCSRLRRARCSNGLLLSQPHWRSTPYLTFLHTSIIQLVVILFARALMAASE